MKYQMDANINWTAFDGAVFVAVVNHHFDAAAGDQQRWPDIT